MPLKTRVGTTDLPAVSKGVGCGTVLGLGALQAPDHGIETGRGRVWLELPEEQ